MAKFKYEILKKSLSWEGKGSVYLCDQNQVDARIHVLTYEQNDEQNSFPDQLLLWLRLEDK